MTIPWRGRDMLSPVQPEPPRTSPPPAASDPPGASAGTPATARAAPERRKPRLRGVSHEAAALAAVPAALLLAATTRAGPARTAALVYGAALVALFSVSAVYHRLYWPAAVRHLIGRVDHAAIFLLVAGTYTPIGVLLGPGAGRTLLALVWGGALLGIVVVVWLTGTPRPVRASLYVLLGWLVVPVLPALRTAAGDGALALLLAGGLLYTVGAAIYALRRPDPFPEVFGFHEIFHLLVIGAAACHYAVVHAALAAVR